MGRTRTLLVDDLALDDVKAHLRVDGTEEDAYITLLMSASRAWADQFSRFPVTPSGWSQEIAENEAVPTSITIDKVPHAPSAFAVTYTPVGGGGDLEFSDYTVEYTPTLRCFVATANSDVPATEPDSKPVLAWETIPGDDNTRDLIQHARKVFVGDQYENRESGSIPDQAENLLRLVMEPGI